MLESEIEKVKVQIVNNDLEIARLVKMTQRESSKNDKAAAKLHRKIRAAADQRKMLASRKTYLESR